MDHLLHHPAPDERRDAEDQRDPEAVPEHRHAVPFMAVVCTRVVVSAARGLVMLFMACGRRVISERHRETPLTDGRRGTLAAVWHSRRPVPACLSPS